MSAQYLSLTQQQQQVMKLAPQMRQSLEMLQMPITELRAAIQKEMEENPTIDSVKDPTEIMLSEAIPESSTEHVADQELDFDPDIDALLRQDDHWRDYFLQGMENAPASEEADEKRQYLFNSIRQQTSLQDHLLEQLTLTQLDPKDREIATILIGNITTNGYFAGSLPDLIMVTGYSEEKLLSLLNLIQSFDPLGVGARNLSECLLLQLEAVQDSPWEPEARILIEEYLPQLADNQESFLCKTLELEPHELQQVVALIKSLDPRPGLAFEQNITEYVEPEVFIVKEKGRYVVKVEEGNLPTIRISRHYRRLLEDPQVAAETKSYIRERIRAGAFLIRSIHQRQETIRKIVQEIVDNQTDFLEEGIQALRPMTMAEIAQSTGVHETTVSRTVANKYAATPQGVLELKAFFTTGIQTKDGDVISNRSVQERIAQLVAAEDPRQPLSDQAILNLLKERGIKLARRTIAKYRDILKIPSSHQRRRK